MAHTEVRLLGDVQVRVDGSRVRFGSSKRHRLLAFLAYRGDWIRRTRLAAVFWADLPDRAAHANLRQTLHKLGHVPWLSGLEIEPTRVRWAVQTDVSAFWSSLAEEAWTAAVDLYGGVLMDGLELESDAAFADWLALERDHLEGRWREAMQRVASAHRAAGRFELAAATYDRLLAHDPLDEDALRASMTCTALGGRPARALASYDAFAARLRQELDLEPSRATARVAQDIADDRLEPLDDEGRVAASVNRLPGAHAAATFVGRRRELGDLRTVLRRRECRLVTLVGVGGVGKSRMALECAAGLAGDYADGAWFVPLENVSSADLLPSAIADALGLSLHGADPAIDQVARHLTPRHLLLVLDNMEHLVAGAASIDQLLRSCPRLQVMATSRERLALPQEWLMRVDGLAYPLDAPAASDVGRYDALVLFAERARQVKPGFGLAGEEVEGAAAICRLVDGVPLAIELAATWVRVLSTSDVAREIEQTVDFLSTSDRQLSRRHHSIRATFEHSWGLLAPTEREAFRRLAVFVASFDRDAASAVTSTALPVLASLVDKSLLRVTSSGRYDRHPLLYQFTSEKLEEVPTEAARLRVAHAEYFLALLDPARVDAPHAIGAVLDVDLENAVAAARHAAQWRRLERLGPAIAALARHFEVRGRFRDGVERLDEIAAAISTSTVAERRALGAVRTRQAWLVHWVENEAAERLAHEALALLRPARDRTGMALALRVLGVTAWRAGAYADAAAHLRAGLRLVDDPAHEALKAILLDAAGLVASARGDYEGAERLHREALALNERLGEREQVVHNLVNLASFLWRIGDPAVAVGHAERALVVATEIDFQQYVPFCLAEIAWCRLAMDEPIRASALGVEAARLGRLHGDTFALTLALLVTAQAAADLDDVDEADTHVRAALAVAWSIRDLGLVLRAIRVGAAVELRRGRAERAIEWLTLVRRHGASPHWNVVEADRWLDRARAACEPGERAAAEARGRDLTLEAVVSILGPTATT